MPRKGFRTVVAWRNWRLIDDRALYDLERDPTQQTNVLGQHPETVARLRAAYETWWSGVEPETARPEAIRLGSDHENPTVLTPADWLDVFLDQAGSVRSGQKRNGAWIVEVERPGSYLISLHRWPGEAGLAMDAPAPAYHGPDGGAGPGVALPVVAARLRIGALDQRRDVEPGAKAAPFSVRLEAGRTELQTWLYDGQGGEICGAYYVSVRRL